MITPNSFLNFDMSSTWYIYEFGMIPVDLVKIFLDIYAKIPLENIFT